MPAERGDKLRVGEIEPEIEPQSLSRFMNSKISDTICSGSNENIWPVKEVCVSHSNFSFLMALDADAFLGDEDERREFIESEFSDRFGTAWTKTTSFITWQFSSKMEAI